MTYSLLLDRRGELGAGRRNEAFRWTVPQRNKKAGAIKHPKVLDRVGLLLIRPPGTAGLPVI